MEATKGTNREAETEREPACPARRRGVRRLGHDATQELAERALELAAVLAVVERIAARTLPARVRAALPDVSLARRLAEEEGEYLTRAAHELEATMA